MRTLAAAVGVAALPTAATATPPTPDTLTGLADFSGPVPQGTFTPTPPLCASGTFVSEPIAGAGGPVASTFAGLQHLSCDDGSGAFTILFHPQDWLLARVGNLQDDRSTRFGLRAVDCQSDGPIRAREMMKSSRPASAGR
jgi:hypothetical protein